MALLYIRRRLLPWKSVCAQEQVGPVTGGSVKETRGPGGGMTTNSQIPACLL